jgi:hypothetical protein
VVLRVHGDTHGGTDDPMVGKGLRPKWVDFKLRRFNAGGFNGSPFLEKQGSDAEHREKREEASAYINSSVHDCPPHCDAVASDSLLLAIRWDTDSKLCCQRFSLASKAA